MPNNINYSHETVVLEAESFSGCEFRDCRLIYAGGEPATLTNCKFVNCDWRLEGAASNTLAHLKLMWSAGSKAEVQAIIKDITAVR
jgi:uncharacterized protein YjbI with pentapeptide repeats